MSRLESRRVKGIGGDSSSLETLTLDRARRILPRPAMLQLTELLTVDAPVSAPEGLVYSTGPRRASNADGIDYFVKGPAQEVVFAELAGCLLATEAGIPVAPVAGCVFEGDKLAGSEKVSDMARNIEPFLRNPRRVRNLNDLFAAIVVDTWLCNTDRNMGNVIGRAVGNGSIDLVMIDFEKSATLRPTPTIASAMVEPRSLWPTGELGRLVKSIRPLHPPAGTIDKITKLAHGTDVAEIINDVCLAFMPVQWAEGSIDVIVARGKKISELAGEVWASV